MRYSVLVIGAGHAGVEAALASARLGLPTALLTSNLDTAPPGIEYNIRYVRSEH